MYGQNDTKGSCNYSCFGIFISVEYILQNGTPAYTTITLLMLSVLINLFSISSTVDEAAMRSVAILLKALPLQPDCVDQDITEAKSELFLK